MTMITIQFHKKIIVNIETIHVMSAISMRMDRQRLGMRMLGLVQNK